MNSMTNGNAPHCDSKVIEGVRLPLENIEFTIEQYLLANGAWLDTETRCLLAGVRDGVRRIAGSTHTSPGEPSFDM